jgi:hypothetical protein
MNQSARENFQARTGRTYGSDDLERLGLGAVARY